jgi:threonylcarbamoyladenosine tRNA methylthiotransferase MtaB
MTTPRTCRLVTLGCKVNQYETQYAREMLEANGYREAADGEPADLCLVNTCTVTHESDAKGRQAIRRLAHDNPGAAIVVMGCFATRAPETVAALPGVVKVVTDKARLADELREFGVSAVPAGITRFDGHQRAFVKVQDGCLLNCTYCIIPHVRPTMRSRPPEEIVAEVRGLVERGWQEVVLTGVHLGHYGIDLSRGRPKERWRRLWHLLEELADLPGDFRIRLSSLEAAEARDEMVRVLAGHPRICPHLHLCLQSGSDRVLAAMQRRYRSAGFLERCRRLWAALDEPAFTTDVIIGFPGETEADFEDTCRVVREVGFCKVHVFSYSPRQGTAAVGLPGAVPPAVMAARRERLLALEAETMTAYHRRLIGRRLDVLVEGADPDRPGWARGTSCRYATVAFPGHAPALLARRVPVVGAAVEDGTVLGHPEPKVTPERVALPFVAL